MEDIVSTSLASLGLQGRILEVAVVVGMDEETGLQLRSQNRYNQNIGTPSLFEAQFQGYLLDILSGPQDGANFNSPLKDHKASWKQPLKHISIKRGKSIENRSSKGKKLQRMHSVRKLRKKANTKEEVPVSTDFLSNLPSICLPEDSKVYRMQPESRFHSSVLTDIAGVHHYAAVLTFYRQYHATEAEDKTWKLNRRMQSKSLESSPKNGVTDSDVCYVPFSVCLISNKAYFEVLKDCLSCYHKELAISAGNASREVLEKLVTNLSLIVCPPPLICMRFSYGTLPIVLPPPEDPLRPDQIVDVDLRLPLFIFMKDPSVLMSVLTCIMLEQRIVFFSEDYAILPLVMECFLTYIRPMEWHHQYIPILFSEIVGFVDCPGIFMMGCHSRHKLEIEKVENDLFLVDLDNARIYSNSPTSSNTGDGQSGQFALHMPEFAVDALLRRISELRLHNTVANASVLNTVSLEDMRLWSVSSRTQLNKRIQNVFMDFMVDIFGETMQYIDHERNKFNRTEFLENIQPTDTPFYIKAVKTYMFMRFIKQRLKQTQDKFSFVVENRILRRNVLRIQQQREKSKIRSLNILSEYKQPHPDKCSGRSASADTGIRPPGRKGSYLQAMEEEYKEDCLFSEINLNPNHFSSSPSSNRDIAGKISSSGVSTQCDDEYKPMSKVNNPVFTLTMPTFPVQGTNFNAHHFYRRCIDAITEALEKINLGTKDPCTGRLPDHTSVRAGLLLLRGLYSLAEGNLVQGWKDLHTTAKEDARFFPENIIRNVAHSLNDNERAYLQNNSTYKVTISRTCRAPIRRSISTTRNEHSHFFNENDAALFSLTRGSFAYVLEKNDVTTDDKIISLLYQALSENSSNGEVDPENFNAFFQTWKQLKHECEMAKNSFELGIRMSQEGSGTKKADDAADLLTFRPTEQILKVSGIVLSSKGNGRIVLTTRRLLFIAAGNQECKSIISLKEILFVSIGKIKNFMSSTTAIVVNHQHDSTSPLKVGLKSESELWCHLINEMTTGKNLSEDQRDHMVTLDTALHNVLLAEAFYTSTRDEDLMVPSDAMIWVSKLCNFENMKKLGELKSFTTDTEKMLVLCIDPTPKQSKKSGIKTMLYSAASIDEIPRIWVALGSGKIRIVDTTQWNLDPKPVEAWKSKPCCMCLVHKKELWVGADDGTIYILLIATMKMVRILHDHSSSVVAIVAYQNGKSVVSASRSGDIIIWNAEPTMIHHRFSVFSDPHEVVAFISYKDKFCCLATTFITICDMEGNILQNLILGEFSTMAASYDLTCCTWDDNNELWAADSHGAIYRWDISPPKTEANSSIPSSLHMSYLKKKEPEELKPKYSGILSELHSGIGITCMLKQGHKVWLGKSNGEIVIYNAGNGCQENVLQAHDGPVTSLCKLENRYMVSGSGNDGGKVIVWRQ